MNQEDEPLDGATASSTRTGWPRRSQNCDRMGLASFGDMEQYNDVASTEDTSIASVSVAGSCGPTAAAKPAQVVSYTGSGAPCGACKFLRRKCVKDCVFAPYFAAEHGAARFAAVHKIFGASNVNKLLRSIPPQKRFDAVVTISYEAQARITNPVYGCVAAIAELQQQVQSLQSELNNVQTQLASSRHFAAVSCLALQQHQQQQQQQQQANHVGGAFLGFDHAQSLCPMNVQPMICPQIFSPPNLVSFNRHKDEEENNMQSCISPLYPIAIPSTAPLLSAHVQSNGERNHPHLSIDLGEKNENTHAPTSTSTSQLHALLRTRSLNLQEST